MSKVISEQLMFDSLEIQNFFTSKVFIEQLGYTYATFPTLILPNTYEFYWNTEPEQFFIRMMRERKKFWNEERLAKAKALNMMAIIEIAKRANSESISYNKKFRCANDIYDMTRYELENENQECFLVIYFNIKMQVIKKEILFKGGTSSSFIDINLIFKNAIMYGAKNIICIHNHPSNNVLPSKEDEIHQCSI